MSKVCSLWLREQGLPNPRTCALCGLGPCVKSYVENSTSNVELKLSEADQLKFRSNYLTVVENYNLNLACEEIVRAWGPSCYHVGSSLVRPDYRDVDLRLILSDEEFSKIFPDSISDQDWGPKGSGAWKLICTAISERLARKTGLNVDFQIQSQSVADKYSGARNPVGIREAM